jgi:transaldolase/fructose-6-phosphate aldolase-like protein
MKFFFDTADADYIRNTWAKYSNYTDSSGILGVTTNPNALHKVNCKSLADLENVIKSLNQVLNEISKAGEIFIQLPHSSMNSLKEVVAWAQYIKTMEKDPIKIGIKIPHYTLHLVQSRSITDLCPGMSVNVTGIADWAHILKAFTFESVTYASLIPGRMDEAGINSTEHLMFLFGLVNKPKQQIITGSMRTLEGLSEAILYGTIPTIGARLWDLMSVENFINCWDRSKVSVVEGVVDKWKNSPHGPEVTDKNVKLSQQFFEQMDTLGKPIYDEFVRSL